VVLETHRHHDVDIHLTQRATLTSHDQKMDVGWNSNWNQNPTTRLSHGNLFCSSAVLDPRAGHTMDVLSPFFFVLCHSD